MKTDKTEDQPSNTMSTDNNEIHFFINGVRFKTRQKTLTQQQLCDMIKVPFGNALIYINDGPFAVPPLTKDVPIERGDSIQIMRAQVGLTTYKLKQS